MELNWRSLLLLLIGAAYAFLIPSLLLYDAKASHLQTFGHCFEAGDEEWEP
jgi:hypothetical protein